MEHAWRELGPGGVIRGAFELGLFCSPVLIYMPPLWSMPWRTRLRFPAACAAGISATAAVHAIGNKAGSPVPALSQFWRGCSTYIGGMAAICMFGSPVAVIIPPLRDMPWRSRLRFPVACAAVFSLCCAGDLLDNALTGNAGGHYQGTIHWSRMGGEPGEPIGVSDQSRSGFLEWTDM